MTPTAANSQRRRSAHPPWAGQIASYARPPVQAGSASPRCTVARGAKLRRELVATGHWRETAVPPPSFWRRREVQVRSCSEPCSVRGKGGFAGAVWQGSAGSTATHGRTYQISSSNPPPAEGCRPTQPRSGRRERSRLHLLRALVRLRGKVVHQSCSPANALRRNHVEA